MAAEPATDYLAPVYAVIDRQAAAGEPMTEESAPVTVTLADGTHAVLTPNMLCFPRAAGALTGKSVFRTLLERARGTRMGETPPTTNNEEDR